MTKIYAHFLDVFGELQHSDMSATFVGLDTGDSLVILRLSIQHPEMLLNTFHDPLLTVV